MKGLKDELTKQNNKLIDVRNDVTSMKKRLESLERKEATLDEAIDVTIREREKKQEKRKRFEVKVKAEIEEEERKIMVIGFPISNKSEEVILPELVTSMMREGAIPKDSLSIEWIKEDS